MSDNQDTATLPERPLKSSRRQPSLTSPVEPLFSSVPLSPSPLHTSISTSSSSESISAPVVTSHVTVPLMSPPLGITTGSRHLDPQFASRAGVLPSGDNAASPCYVHTHLDSSLADWIRKDAEERRRKRDKADRRAAKDARRAALFASPSLLSNAPREPSQLASSKVDFDLGDQQDESSPSGSSTEGESDSDDERTLTKQLAETAMSVREMSKQLGRARVKSSIQSIMIITKARDNHLIKLTRDLAVHLMTSTRSSSQTRGITV